MLRTADDEIDRFAEGHAVATVRFGEPSDAELDAYLAGGEPLAVAGAFTSSASVPGSSTASTTTRRT